ncbi:MAG: hypothetical protein ACXWTP_10600 [Methylosarcina sp.]
MALLLPKTEMGVLIGKKRLNFYSKPSASRHLPVMAKKRSGSRGRRMDAERQKKAGQ